MSHGKFIPLPGITKPSLYALQVDKSHPPALQQSHSLLAVPTTNKHGSKHYNTLNMHLVSRFFHQVSGRTRTNGVRFSVLVGLAPPTMIRPNPCSTNGSSDFLRPTTTVSNVECQSITTAWTTVGLLCIKSGGSSHIFDRISNTVLLPVMVNAERLDGTPLLSILQFSF